MNPTMRRWIRKIPFYIVLIGLSGLVVLPFFWMVISSLKTNQQLFSLPVKWWVWPLQFHNYSDALLRIPFFSQLQNTAMLAAFTVVGNVLSGSFIAYGLAKIDWPGRRPLFGVLLVTMLLPGVVTFVPTYLIFRDLGWINTYLPLIVPTFLGTPYYIFLFRQFFLTIPESVSEAARVDGANEIAIYGRIIIPLCAPVISAVAVLSFVSAWTEYVGPLIYLNLPNQWTLSLGLTEFLNRYSADWNLMMAAAVVFTVPLIALFFFANKYFMRGISFNTDIG